MAKRVESPAESSRLLEGAPEINYSGSSAEVRIEDAQSAPVTGSSWFASGFLVINAALGAGMLNFPAAYHAAGGVTVALSIQMLLLVFIVVALFILAYCSDVSRSATYQDVIYSVCGRAMYIVCSVCIVLYCYGTCVTFLIIIGDMLDRFFFSISGATFCHSWYMNRSFTMTVSSVVLILPLCFPKRIDFLKYASFLGFIGVVYLLVLIICKYSFETNHPGPIRTKPDDLIEVFNVVPAICFGYQCHVSVVPIYSCLAKRSLREFAKVVTMAMALVCLVYSVGSVLAYWTFGGNVQPDIFESYYPDTAVLAGIFMFAAKTYTTYPILLFCGRAGVESIRTTIMSNVAQTATNERVRRYIITTVWFVSNVILAVFIPNIGSVIQFLGCLAAAFIFLFPGLCLLQIGMKRREVERTVLSSVMIVCSILFMVFGTFMFGITIVQAVMKMASGTAQTTRVCT